MPNSFKYSTDAQTLALKKGNFWIGVGDVDKGPTSTTGYWNGITPPADGYTIYLNKVSNGPSIYVANNNTQLISLTNGIAGANYTTANECFNYFVGQSDKMVVNREYEGIVTNGLVLNVDAGFTPSYPSNGNTWYDISSSGNNGTLTNGPTYSSSNGGTLVFDGVDDYVDCGANSITKPTGSMTISYWFKGVSSTLNFAVGVGAGGFSGQRGYILGPNTGTQLAFFIAVNSTNVVAATYNVTINTSIWYHISGVFLASNYLKIFLNGSEVASNTSSIPSSQFAANGLTLKIGSRGDAYYFTGSIAQFSMYHRALSSAEILQNFNAQKSRFGL
jgi:hypothetical protein